MWPAGGVHARSPRAAASGGGDPGAAKCPLNNRSSSASARPCPLALASSAICGPDPLILAHSAPHRCRRCCQADLTKPYSPPRPPLLATRRRVMLKVSGEALEGSQGFGIDPVVLQTIASEVAAAASEGVEIAIVVGGGK